MPMTHEDHKRMFESFRQMVWRVFHDDDAQQSGLMSVVFAIKDGKHEVYAIALSNTDALEAFVVDLVDKGREAVCLVNEAWSLEGDDLDMAWVGRIAEHPNRIEIVSMVYSFSKGELMAKANIIRPSETESYLTEWEVHEDATLSTESRLGGFWEKARRKHAKDN